MSQREKTRRGTRRRASAILGRFTARIHCAYAYGQDPDEIAHLFRLTTAAIVAELRRFNYRHWIGDQTCAECGRPPGERDRGVLTHYRGAYICASCLMAGGVESDWYATIRALIDRDDG